MRPNGHGTLRAVAAASLLALAAWPAVSRAQTLGPAATACTQVTAGQGWVNQTLAAQRARFTLTVDVTPGADQLDQFVGLSQGSRSAADGFAALLRFGADGVMQARSGTQFTAQRRLRYRADATYRVRLDVDPAAGRYSVWVQAQTGNRQRPFRQLVADAALAGGAGQVIDNLGLLQATQAGQNAQSSLAGAAADPAMNDALRSCNLQLAAAAPLPPNPNCTLIVPANPLTAQGLATPYQLVATDPKQGACHQANADQQAFVQAVILDPATGQLSVYAPLVIDKGTQPAVAPVLPTLPANAVVGLWFGYNGDNLTLGSSTGNPASAARGGGSSGNSLVTGKCVNGLGGSVFGQFAYCNAPAFFGAAQAAIGSGRLVVPAPGTGVDGKTCPTSRSYWVIDQDPSDNVPAEYIDTGRGFAQATAANWAAYPQGRKIVNPSDERLVAKVLDPALGCTPYTAPDLADPGHQVSALALNELQAAAHQAAPVALIPPQDPMVLVDGERSLAKLNAYRAGVGQPPATDVSDASAALACRRFRSEAPARFVFDQPWFLPVASPAPADANSLYTFLANRYVASYGLLGCKGLLHRPVNMKLTVNAAGQVTDATLR